LGRSSLGRGKREEPDSGGARGGDTAGGAAGRSGPLRGAGARAWQPGGVRYMLAKQWGTTSASATHSALSAGHCPPARRPVRHRHFAQT
jgi:hypothetical protein